MSYLAEYLLFLVETATVVVAIVVGLSALLRSSHRGPRGPGRLTIRRLDRHYQAMGHTIEAAGLPRGDWKSLLKRRQREAPTRRDRRVFVIDFSGDLRASAVASLREEVTGLLSGRRENDEVVVRIESVGGLVAAYGLAASQLARLREAGVPLTVCIDRVAASGGYLMASVAERVVAAPFAVVGSIGVIAQLPNFHRLLKRNDIDWEQFQAGDYKRTVTLFGETTEANRAKMQEQVEEAHALFKAFLARYRPTLDLERVATGEYWYGDRALALGLVDELRTSDDYLLEAARRASLFQVRYVGGEGRRRWPLPMRR